MKIEIRYVLRPHSVSNIYLFAIFISVSGHRFFFSFSLFMLMAYEDIDIDNVFVTHENVTVERKDAKWHEIHTCKLSYLSIVIVSEKNFSNKRKNTIVNCQYAERSSHLYTYISEFRAKKKRNLFLFLGKWKGFSFSNTLFEIRSTLAFHYSM